jgi:hypothetical protein
VTAALRTAALLAGAALSGLGCGGFAAEDVETVPDTPSFARDIAPLFASHCLHCHSEQPARGAPSYFRLDVHEDADGIAGAKTMGRAAWWEVAAGRMPPGAPLGGAMGPRGQQLLQRWVEQGRAP